MLLSFISSKSIGSSHTSASNRNISSGPRVRMMKIRVQNLRATTMYENPSRKLERIMICGISLAGTSVSGMIDSE